jgi:hypothetical protein
MKIVLLIGLMTITGGMALAQESAQQAHKTVATDCKSDLQTFCKDVKPGAGRLLSCLDAHYARLSASCKTALDNAHAEGRNAPAAPH